ncbi:MAG: hypothetical protein ACK4PI_06655 [Tepidisphaerales bacterium]
MKTWAKAFLAAVGLACGVGGYLWWSAPAPLEAERRGGALVPSTRPLDAAGGVAGIGAGERPWANQYDERGELAYRFRARQYNPLDSGTVDVEAPTFEFFLTGGRRVRLVGERGQVFLPRRSPGRQGSGDALGGQASLPSRGTLRNVQITLLEPGSDASSLTAVMDNVIFDNDTLRIWTGESVIDGVPVPGNRIPVVVRGDDYEFDGEGLTIQLAQRGERTIQRVEVARATRLLIKSGELPGLGSRGPGRHLPPDGPGDVRLATASASAAWTAALSGASAAARGGGGALLLAQAGGRAGGGAAAGGGGAVVRPVADTVYRATFRHGVRIVQGGNTLSGDILQVDFSSVERPRPAAAGGEAREGTLPPQPQGPSSPPDASPSSGAPAPQGVTDTSTDGAASPRQGTPVLITWDGPLRVEADAGDPHTPPGEAVVTLFAGERPVELVTAGDGGSGGVGAARAVAAAMTYETAHRRATLQGSTLVPVTLSDDRGSVVTTPLLTYELDQGVAVLTGVSVLRASVDTDERGTPRQMLASWSRRAVVRFQQPGSEGSRPAATARHGGPRGGGLGPVATAELAGTVRVDHPELQLSADTLLLSFDAGLSAAGEPERRSPAMHAPAGAAVVGAGSDLREVYAEGNVAARLLGGRNPGTLQGRTLRMTTTRDAAGRVVAERIEAGGDVVASDGTQTLQARGLVIELAPEPEGGERTAGGPAGGGVMRGGGGVARVRPQTVSASGDVVATSADGSQIRSQTLTIGNVSTQRVVFIEGPGSSVSAEGNELTADRIIYREADGEALIPVGGTLKGVQRASRPGERDTPFTVTWSQQAKLTSGDDGGRIDVLGDVRFESLDADGAVSTAQAEQLTVHLTAETVPPTGSAATGAAADGDAGRARGTTSDAGGDVPRVRLLGRRQLAAIELQRRVALQSVLGDSEGRLVRQFNLFSEVVRYDGSGRLEVPAAGRLLLIDRRPKEAGGGGPAVSAAQGSAPGPSGDTRPAPGADGAISADGRGNTAMQWERSLVYEPADRQLTFDGAVVFVHEPLPDGTPPAEPPRRYRLDSDRLTVYLEGAGSARPAGFPDSEQLDQVRTVIADGVVSFRGDGLTIFASELEYVPALQVVLARGNDRQPVRIEDDRAIGTGTFTSARVNLKTGLVEEVREPRGSIGLGGMPLPTPRRGSGR